MTTELTFTLRHEVNKTNQLVIQIGSYMSVTWLMGGDQPWVLGTLIYEGFKL